nr:cyanophycin synthetase [Buchnera aphidicola]
MHTPSGTINISLPFLGYQSISNVLAATALAFSINIPLKKIKNGLLKTPIVSGRLELIQLKPHKILINDTYNANVSSMIAAIKVLENMPKYKILVTGDMSELGEKSILYHKMIGNIANLSNIDEILTIGNRSYEISKTFNNGKHFFTKEKLNKYLKKIFFEREKITILVKGSRNAKMEKIVQNLIKESQEHVNLVV